MIKPYNKKPLGKSYVFVIHIKNKAYIIRDKKMIIGILTIELRVFVEESIKEKRNITRSIREKLRKKFNVSVSEIQEENRNRGHALIAVSAVSGDSVHLQSSLSNAYNLVERFYPDFIESYHIELLDYFPENGVI